MPADKGAGLNPHKATQIAVVGKKGSGKTELAYLLFESYPYDRILVDPNSDIKVPEDTEELETGGLARWPTADPLDRNRRRTFRYVPDFGAGDYVEDLDRVVGMAYTHPRTLLFIDEAHEAAPAGRTPPHMRRALRQGRHRQLSSIYVTPRPLTVDALMLSNADWVYVFKLPNPNDRRRVAETIGWDPRDFDDAVHALGPYEYLRHGPAKDPTEEHQDELVHMPALPRDQIKGHRPG